MKTDIKILVATHKSYIMPKDKMYMPIQVGAELHSDILLFDSKNNREFLKDNKGKNISGKNSGFCELTAMYWAWKNVKTDYVGLCHYRRYLGKRGGRNNDERLEKILSQSEVKKILEREDVILPKARNYLIENLYDHYKHTMYVEPLDEAGRIIKEKYPKYYPEFEKLHTRRRAHMFNMFIMKKDIFDEYAEWLFDILFELEKRVDVSRYDDFHKRYLGRVSELLLDVFLRTEGIRYAEVPVVDIEGVNWMKKGLAFLRAKFFGKKYGKSF